MRPDGARVLIVTAMPEELAAFSVRRLPEGVEVAATGEGPLKAARGVEELVRRHRPKLLVGAGMAGALSMDLGLGDILIARRVCDAGGDAPAPDERLFARAAAMPGVRAGVLYSTDRILVAAREKADLSARIGDVAAGADMESASWARTAAANGIPYVVVRAISDTADENLPTFLAECLDAEGGIRRSAVAWKALTHPASLPALLAMRRRVRDAGQRLAAFVAAFLAAEA